MCRLCVLIATTDPSVSPSPGNPFRFSLSSWKIDPVCFPVANWSKCLTHVFPEPGKMRLKTILISHLIYLFVLLIKVWMSIPIRWCFTAKRKLERLQFSTSSSFGKIWSACSCEFKAYFWTFGALYNFLFDLETIGVNQIIIWWLVLEKKPK